MESLKMGCGVDDNQDFFRLTKGQNKMLHYLQNHGFINIYQNWDNMDFPSKSFIRILINLYCGKCSILLSNNNLQR